MSIEAFTGITFSLPAPFPVKHVDSPVEMMTTLTILQFLSSW